MLVVCAIAVKQAAYILMHGSIFESLRNWIYSKMEDEVFGFEKLNELFTCKVCMTTQVSIWLISVPLMFSGLLPSMSLIGMMAVFLCVAFAVSGLAVLFWNLFEYKVQKFEELRRSYEQRESEIMEELSTLHESELAELKESYERQIASMRNSRDVEVAN